MNVNEPVSLRTRASLLLRLQDSPSDQAAWGEFVREAKIRIE